MSRDNRLIIFIGFSIFLSSCSQNPTGIQKPAESKYATKPIEVPPPQFPAADAQPGYLTAKPPDNRDGGDAAQDIELVEYPFPQNPELQKKRHAERLAWYRKQIVETFDKKGQTNQTWSAKAREALDLCAQTNAVEWGLRLFLLDRRDALLKELIEADCDDPQVRFFAWSYLGKTPSSQPNGIRLLKEIVDQFHKDRYPIDRRLLATGMLCDARAASVPDPYFLDARSLAAGMKRKAPPPDLTPYYDPVWPILAEAAKERHEIMERMVLERVLSLQRLFVKSGKSRKEGFDRAKPLLQKSEASEWLLRQMEGLFCIEFAWDARGSDYANKVPAEAMEQFQERLLEAEEHLEAAWKLEPSRPGPARYMITVAMGRSFPRREMEAWFQRAMTADPSDREACTSKLLYLTPKWGGSFEEVLAFGRQCIRTSNWDAGLPLLYVRGLIQEVGQLHADVINQPNVWADLRDLCEPRILSKPDDRYVLSLYAKLASFTEQIDLTHYLFLKLDGKPLYDDLTFKDPAQFASLAEKIRVKYLENEVTKRIAPAGKK
jgi:hypothetical protein